MKTIHYYEIVMSVYHGTPVGRIRFFNPNIEDIDESGLNTPNELSNILCLWKQGELLGSFGMDTILAPDATFIICEQ